MIAHIRGKVLFEFENSIVIDVHGLGYKVYSPERTRTLALSENEISLFIHTIVRETALELYGFETKNEVFFFKKLLDVSGIGPRSALAIIELASTDTLYQAIVSNNVDFLMTVPGIGKKTAERICIELRDNLKDYEGNTELKLNETDRDVIDALLALGYSSAQAHQALSKVPEDIRETNERIKRALSELNSLS